MRSPETIAREAKDCWANGDHHGYGERLLELEAQGFSATERARLLSGESLDQVLGCVPVQKSTLTE